jgi:hypothetical protein
MKMRLMVNGACLEKYYTVEIQGRQPFPRILGKVSKRIGILL